MEEFNPKYSSNQISELNREQTLEVISDIRRLASHIEDMGNEYVRLKNQRDEEVKKAEDIRNAVSASANRIRWIIVIVAAVIGTFIIPIILTAVFAFVGYLIAEFTVIKKDKENNAGLNEQNYNEYIQQNVQPIQDRIASILGEYGDIKEGEEYKWCIDIIGEGNMKTPYINEIYKLLETRRADNLKEALNKYDDNQYKQQMADAQQAIMNATELAAAEASKQTAISQQIEQNTHEAATAAKWTAVNTGITAHRAGKIEKNTRR